MSEKSVAILGAGLVGSLLSIFLRKRGYKVDIFERRRDMRLIDMSAGRSINLALSLRGLAALLSVGLEEKVKEICIPMHGRMIHNLRGETELQPYGKRGEFINSVSRSALNEILMTAAEEEGVDIHFNHKCDAVDHKTAQCDITKDGTPFKVKSDWVFGADGAFSSLRSSLLKTQGFNYSQNYISAAYKELSIPPTKEGDFALEPHALHVWPRGEYMLIALPNLDKSFTCTLFYPRIGRQSFEEITDGNDVLKLFKEAFPDTLSVMPTLLEDFFENPTSGLVTVRCSPWVKGKTALIGDAAHAIVPFYGQGMNAGFEDCFVFDQLVAEHGTINEEMLIDYENLRKPDADAIADLALYNFIEMRDKVADPKFLLQKRIEKELFKRYPDKWVPLYSMVTFSQMRYSDALKKGMRQQGIMDQLLENQTVTENLDDLDFESIIAQLY